MKNRILFLIFCLTIIQTGNSQTFLGKRFKVSAGTSMNWPVSIFFNKNYAEFDRTIFPPKIEGHVGVALASRIEFNAFITYHGVRNSKVSINTEAEDDVYIRMNFDEYLMRSNVSHLGINFKLYSEYAPIGNYLTIGMGYSKSKSTVYPTLIHTRFQKNGTQQNVTTDVFKLPEWELNSSFYCFELGFGRSNLLKPNLFIDYGVKTSIYFGKPKSVLANYSAFEDASTYDYRQASELLITRAVWSNIQSLNLIQLYVNFGFTK